MKIQTRIIAGLLASSLLLPAAELKIAENGIACAGILIPEKTKPVVELAAKELAVYLKKITGAEFQVGTSSKFKTNFKLGFGDPKGLENEEFIIRTSGNDIEIFGRDAKEKYPMFNLYFFCKEKGTLQGVYYFLEQLGVRWPAPGMDHVPEQKTLVLKPLDIRFKPYFKDRRIGSGANSFMGRWPDAREYCTNNDEAMMWYLRIGESPRQFAHGCHSEHSLALYKDPEWKSDVTRLQLNKGKRDPRYSCWTHPDVKKIWMKAADAYFSGISAYKAGFKYASTWGRIGWRWPSPFTQPDEFMIDPMDHSQNNDGRCYCDRCQEYRKTHPCPDDTDMIWEVIGDVADSIREKHPGCYITTLIYPPKHGIPARKLPSNIRVRLCLTGPKTCLDPAHFEKEFETVRTWEKITGHKVPLWTYHCADFNHVMPHIVETYPHLLKKYILSLKENGEGMYMETSSQTFTRVLLETYIYHRLMRDPDLDLDQALDEYCRILYGPAHREARQFHTELENLFLDFWHKTVPAGSKIRGSSPEAWKSSDSSMRKKLWTLTYTEENLAKLGKLVAAMEEKTASGPYANPVRLLRKYIYNGMVLQRQMLLNREKVLRKFKFTAAAIDPDAVPDEKQWKAASVYQLIPAVLFADKLAENTRFRLISNGKTLFIRCEMDESKMEQTTVRPGQKNGSPDIWKDNCIEFHIASMKDKTFWQLLVNDRGHWSLSRKVKGRPEWIQPPGCEVTVKRGERGWIALVSLPLKTLNPANGKMRLNVVRERRVKGEPVEFSTSSPLAIKGRWQDPWNFGAVTFAK